MIDQGVSILIDEPVEELAHAGQGPVRCNGSTTIPDGVEHLQHICFGDLPNIAIPPNGDEFVAQNACCILWRLAVWHHVMPNETINAAVETGYSKIDLTFAEITKGIDAFRRLRELQQSRLASVLQRHCLVASEFSPPLFTLALQSIREIEGLGTAGPNAH